MEIQYLMTSLGVPVYLVETHQLPIIDMEILFAAGSAYDVSKPGLSAITNSMLFEGSKNHSVDEIAEAFENVGALSSSVTSQDYSAISVRCLSKPEYISKIVNLTQEIISSPSFSIVDFDRVKDQTITSLKYSEQQPDALASRLFSETLYGSEPYGHPHLGKIDTVNAITLTDVKEFYEQYYIRENVKIVMVGDLDKQNALKIAEVLVANLLSGEKAKPIINLRPIAKKVCKKIKFPSTQTTVLIGQIGIKRGSEDYYAFKIGNHILGGGDFNSRLMKNVRVNAGLSYGVSSYFLPLKDYGPFIIFLQTKNDKVQEAISIAHHTLKEFIQNGPTEDELVLAKKNIIGTFPRSISSNSAILTNVSTVAFYDMPLDYLQSFTSNIQSVTLEKVKTAFQKIINMDKLLTITVGD